MISSDYVTVESVIDHPRAAIWELLGQPESYPRFFRSIGSVARLPVARNAQPRYLFLATTGGHTVYYLARMVTNRPGEKLVLASVGGGESRSWASITLSDARAGRSRILVVLAKPEGVEFGGHQGRAAIEAWVREGLRRVDDYLSGVPDEPVSTVYWKPRRDALTLKTLATSGALWPPHLLRGPKQMFRLFRWGFNLPGGYAQAAGRNPHDLAVCDEGGSYTFDEFHRRAFRLVSALIDLSLGHGDAIALMARNRSELLLTTLACEMLGVSVVLLNTGLASRQIEDLMDRHQVQVLFTDDEFERLTQYLSPGLLRVATHTPSQVDGRPTVDDLIAAAPRRRIKPPPKHGELIVLTSGVTGTPKGALRPPPGRWGNVASMLGALQLKAADRIMIAAPIFHSWGFAMWQLSTAIRSTVVINGRFDPERCLAAIAEHKCTVLIAVPILLQRILNLPPSVRARYDTSSLRVVASSGSVIPGAVVTEFMNTFGDILYNFYGSTEVSWATVARPEDLRVAPTTAGYPPTGTRLAILDPDGVPVPRGAVGRIYVHNKVLFKGYTEGGTADIREELMDTGDVGYLDADGRLFVSGRDDEMIVSGGENVYPRPVEEAIAALPQVSEVAVAGVPDPEYGQRLAAFIVLKNGARLDPTLVRSYIHQRLTRFSVPRDVTFLSRMPRSTTGKILKRLLVERSA